MLRSWLRLAALGILLTVSATGAFWYLRSPRPTPVMRGERLARNLGCFGCHGPGGRGGVPNPGSKEGEVPSWDGGTAMMYVTKEADITGYILQGYNYHARENDGRSSHRHGADGHKDVVLKMPAYEGRLRPRDLADLVAYFKVVAGFGLPDSDRASAGYQAASRLGCFGCHGPGGRGGVLNPGSFKGYVPPWDGDDYSELVRNDNELREWILNGISDRFKTNPFARFFLDRQVLKMPAYNDALNSGDLDALVAYVTWLRESADAPEVP